MPDNTEIFAEANEHAAESYSNPDNYIHGWRDDEGNVRFEVRAPPKFQEVRPGETKPRELKPGEMRGKQMFDAMMHHFISQPGGVNAIVGYWKEGKLRDNLNSYNRNLGQGETREEEERAAIPTFTGRMAARWLYTVPRITKIKRHPDGRVRKVRVEFHRREQ